MATIQLSTAIKNELASKIWNRSSGIINILWGAAMPPLVYNNNFGYGGLVYIMKGAVPSNFTGLTIASRTSDILVTFSVANNDLNSSGYVNNVFTMNTSLVAANEYRYSNLVLDCSTWRHPRRHHRSSTNYWHCGHNWIWCRSRDTDHFNSYWITVSYFEFSICYAR